MSAYFLVPFLSVNYDRRSHVGYGGAWGGALVFDILIFIMTVYKSLTLRRSGPRSLLTLMLRDGTLHMCLSAVFYSRPQDQYFSGQALPKVLWTN